MGSARWSAELFGALTAVPGGLQSSLDPRLHWWPAVPGDLQSSLDPRLQWWPAVPGDLQGSLEP